MCRTPSFEAIQWFKKTHKSRIMGNPTAFILVEKAVRILDFTL
jgi:hypothetical protein